MAEDKDLPAISMPNDSTHVDIKPVLKAQQRPAVPAGKLRPPTEILNVHKPAAKDPVLAKQAVALPRRPASEAANVQKPAPAPALKPAVKAPVPAKPAVALPRRPVSEAVNVQKPAPAPALKPAPAPVPVPAPQVAQELAHDDDDDDPEMLLRKYSERQKNKIARLEQQLTDTKARLEQQLTDSKKVVAQRDDYKSKGETLAKELDSARKQLEASAKADEVIKDLQVRVDAAILSNTMLSDENGKLKKSVQELQARVKKLEEKASTADHASVEAQKALGVQSEARKSAEVRIATALRALQGDGALRKAPVLPARK